MCPTEEDLDLILAEYSDQRVWSMGVLPANEDVLFSPAKTLATSSEVIPTATPISSSPDAMWTWP